jgi:hypothetical protein
VGDTDPVLLAGATGALELDGWPKVPVALQLAYRYQHELVWLESLTVRTRGAHVIGGGVYYSGNPDVVIGVSAMGQIVSHRDPYARLARVDFVVQRYF